MKTAEKTKARTTKTQTSQSFFNKKSGSKGKGSFFPSQKKQSTSFFSPTIQAKLEVGSPGDVYEQEADRVADQVMRMPNPGIQRKCNSCKEEEKIQRKPLIQRKVSGNGTQTASPDVASGIAASRGSGRSLDKGLSTEMGSKMGVDFNGVKVHTDSRAIQLSQDLGAKAFTVGNDVYFNKGQYNPSSGEGKRLMAHELVHTVQQVNHSTQLAQRQKNDKNTKLNEREKYILRFNNILKVLYPQLSLIIYLLEKIGWTVNGAAIGIGLEGSISPILGVGAGVENLLFFDTHTYKLTGDVVPYGVVGAGLQAGVGGKFIIAFQMGPIGTAGGGNDYQGLSYGGSIKALAGMGFTISHSLLAGKEGWISTSMSIGPEAGASASIVVSKSGVQIAKPITESITENIKSKILIIEDGIRSIYLPNYLRY